METDIRMMIEGLRPVADFREHVERTIEALPARTEAELIEFWQRVLEGMGE